MSQGKTSHLSDDLYQFEIRPKSAFHHSFSPALVEVNPKSQINLSEKYKKRSYDKSIYTVWLPIIHFVEIPE
jgi:hypothetical protein